MHPHEEAIVRTFIKPEKRDWYLTLLGSKRRRCKALDALNHFRDLRPECCTDLPRETDALSALRAKAAPDTCYVISGIPDIDGREMSLEEVIDTAEAEGWGTLIGCIPGQLAYYYGEAGEQRIVLEKRNR